MSQSTLLVKTAHPAKQLVVSAGWDGKITTTVRRPKDMEKESEPSSLKPYNGKVGNYDPNGKTPDQLETEEEQDDDLISEKSEKKKSRGKVLWARFKAGVEAGRNWIGAILTRVIFLIMSLACIGVSVSSMRESFGVIYLLFLPILLIILEAIATLKYRKNKEWKWVTPCIFAFLLSTVPSIWFMEYQNFERRLQKLENHTTLDALECDKRQLSSLVSNITLSVKSLKDVTSSAHALCMCNDCVPLMVQLLLVILIVGRWMLPKNKSITADQKAQLLLVNIAVAADILELFDILKEDKVKTHHGIIFAVLMVWSASLLQFGIVCTATTKKGPRFFQTEIWALVTLLLLDDLSFLLMRLITMVAYDVVSYNSYFFIAKNGLVLILDVNRIISLSNEMRKEERHKKKYGHSAHRPIRLTHIRR